MNNLKTHSKITLVVSRRNGKIEHFVHLGQEIIMMQPQKFIRIWAIITTKKEYGIDATNFFNYLSGYTEKPKFHQIVVAPFDIRDQFIQFNR